MELQELLAVYQATSATTAGKERTYWGLLGAILLTNAVLLAVGAFFISAPWLEGWKRLTSGVAALGLILTLYWAAMKYRLGKDLALWKGILRQLEEEFAGMEFHRTAYRFDTGQEVRLPATSLRCDAWYPEIARLGPIGRLSTRLFKLLLPGSFLVAWVLLGLSPWMWL